MRLATHDPFKALLDEKLIAQAFWNCLKENDPEGAMEVLNAHLMALGKVQLTASATYQTRSKNPTLRTVAKLIHCSA